MGSQGIVPSGPGVQDPDDLLQGGISELDGDRIDIDVAAVNYTPDTSPPEVDDANQLGARLKGIDNALAGISGNTTGTVRNETGGILTKGTLVRSGGFSVPENLPLAVVADKDIAGGQAVAIVIADIANNDNGEVLAFGVLEDIDTSTFSQNEILILGNAGAYISRPAAGAAHTGIFQQVGIVSRVHGVNGRIFSGIGAVDAVEAGQFGALAGTGTPTDLNPFVTSDDSRIPTQDENNALAGTEGTPNAGNPYVTNQDKRLGPVLTATATLDDTTASATDVLIAGMSITLGAGEDGDYLVEFSSSIENTNNGNTQEVSIYTGNPVAQVVESERRVENGAGMASPVHCIARVNGLNVGDMIEAYWRTSGNTATAHERVLVARRIG